MIFPRDPSRHGALRSACLTLRPAVRAIIMLSMILGLLPLALAIYALLVFDVTLASRSGETLVGFFIIMLVVVIFQTAITILRGRMLTQVASALDLCIGHALGQANARRFGVAGDRSRSAGWLATRYLDSIRTFLAGPAAPALLDMPSALVLSLIIITFNGWLALVLFIFTLVLTGIVALSLARAFPTHEQMILALAGRHMTVETGRRHGETIRGLGMRARAALAGEVANRKVVSLEQRTIQDSIEATDRLNGLLLIFQIGLIFLGAWLDMKDETTTGVVVAVALLAARALEPFRIATGHAIVIAASRQSWSKIGDMLDANPPDNAAVPLPPPTQSLMCEGIVIVAPGSRNILSRNVSFTLMAGDILAVIGRSSCGKSSLLRTLAGIWPSPSGAVRLDGGALDQWEADVLARHIGYLPQTIDLIDGTVSENICRFDPDADPGAIIAAASSAGAHDLIVRLPDGYDTDVGEDGRLLSPAQQQRIALARAFYGDPFLMLLDEPASHIDMAGQRALAIAIEHARARGAIVIAVGNATSTIDAANMILVFNDDGSFDFGPKDEVRQRLADRRSAVSGTARGSGPTVERKPRIQTNLQTGSTPVQE